MWHVEWVVIISSLCNIPILKAFDLSDCMSMVEKTSAVDVQTIAESLRFNNWFVDFAAVDYPVR